MILALQDEIRRTHESRYDHRLHGVLLVAQGMTCLEVARLLGDSTRAVQYWLRRFDEVDFAGLVENERSGRPSRLRSAQLAEISDALRRAPRELGLSTNMWDGKTLSAFLQKRMGITLGARQCQRLFRQLGFRLRKPRPLLARADPEVQAMHKKNSVR